MRKVLIATRIDEKVDQNLMKMALKQDRSKSYLVRKAVEQYVNTKNGKEGDAAPNSR